MLVQCRGCKRRTEIAPQSTVGKRLTCSVCGGSGDVIYRPNSKRVISRPPPKPVMPSAPLKSFTPSPPPKPVMPSPTLKSLKPSPPPKPVVETPFTVKRYKCIRCGTIIPDTRLELNPKTRTCIDCERPINQGNRFANEPFGSRSDYMRDRASWKRSH